MAQGDHLTVSYGLYVHHGVDLGDGRVAQYGGPLSETQRCAVEAVSLAEFARGNLVRVVDSPARFAPEEIAARALSRLGENSYSLLANNCEHFVHWCRSGVARSRQVARVVERVCAVAAKQTTLRSAKLAARSLPRRAAPLLWAADAVQLGVECAASHCGAADEAAQRAGRKAGLAASIGLGFAGGGPAGAALGGGLWALGETVGEKIGQWAADRS